MANMKLSVACAVASLLITSCCAWPVVGGPCRYADFSGVCTVTSVAKPVPGEGSSCANDPVQVRFDFAPTDPGVDYRYPSYSDTDLVLTVAGGHNPPRAWVEAEGLAEGSQHACVRKEIARGTCVPVIFEFTEVDYSAAADQCY